MCTLFTLQHDNSTSSMNKQQNWIVSGSLAAIVTTTVHNLSVINVYARVHQHQTRATSFETAVDTINDLLKVRRKSKSWLAATSHHGSRGNIGLHAIILIVDWWSY